MADRTPHFIAAAALAAFPLASLPIAASAQTSQFYSPPKIVRQGSSSTPVAGTGSVRLKVFVRANGSIGSVEVLKSTNHADDAAATEIAKSSKYKPGARDGKPIDAYYTLALNFKGSAVQADTGAGGGLGQPTALIRAAKYDQAKTELQSYLTGHPGDRDAQALLGVADEYLNDSAGATAAFDAAGSVPDRFKVVAAKAYADAAVDALKAKNNDQAIALSNKALALQSNVNTLYIQGTAYANAQNYAPAIASLEKAKAQATAGHADTATLNAIDSSLASSYILGGQSDKGLALAQELKRRDPSNTRVDDTLAAYYNQQAVAAMKSGNKTAAVSDLETAAKALPSRATILYVQAANVLSQGDKVDWKAVKVEADKALAVDPNDAHANYVAGIALANQGDGKGAIPYLQKAKAAAGSDATLGAQIDTALKKLGGK